MKSDLIDLSVILHHQTEKALLVSDHGDRTTAVWVPKASSEIEKDGTVWKLTLPERVAIEKGLV